MREILFRGKEAYKDRWVNGVPVKATSVDESEILIIESVFECDEYACRGCDFTPVIPETVGQYTGLTDKNGKKIFEGDIVEVWYKQRTLENNTEPPKYKAVIEFGNPNGFYSWGYQLKMIDDMPYNNDILLWVETEDVGAFVEVIGNIHDNPELLGGEAK